MPNETKQSCATAYETMIGGQALIEGIMMLGPEKKAVVVRKPDGGLEEQVEERVLIKDKHPALGLPLLRGVFNFCSSLANGVKALMYSASFFPEAVSSVPEAFSGTAFGAEAASELSVASGVMEGAATDISGFSSVSDIAEGVVPGSPAVFGTASEGVSGFSVLTETAVSEVSASSADKALSVFPGVFPFSVLSDISPDSVPSCWSGLFTSSRLTHPCFPSMVVTPQ